MAGMCASTVCALLECGWVPGLLQVGMRYFNLKKNKYHCPIVNLDKLWSLVGEEVRAEPRWQGARVFQVQAAEVAGMAASSASIGESVMQWPASVPSTGDSLMQWPVSPSPCGEVRESAGMLSPKS